VLRILGPVVILSSLTVLGTGLGLLTVHSHDGGALLTVHQGSFIVWVAAMTIHVLGHVQEAAVTSWGELRRSTPHRRRRVTALLLAIVIGVGGAAVLPRASQWTHRPPDHYGHLGH
jgi:hypothetical protein